MKAVPLQVRASQAGKSAPESHWVWFLQFQLRSPWTTVLPGIKFSNFMQTPCVTARKIILLFIEMYLLQKQVYLPAGVYWFLNSPVLQSGGLGSRAACQVRPGQLATPELIQPCKNKSTPTTTSTVVLRAGERLPQILPSTTTSTAVLWAGERLPQIIHSGNVVLWSGERLPLYPTGSQQGTILFLLLLTWQKAI